MVSENIKKLESYQKQGFLFHGSPFEISKNIEPRKASDADASHKFNNDLAVFASDDYRMTIIYSLMNFSILPMFNGASCSVGRDHQNNIVANLPHEWKDVIEKTIGYVYILPKDSFKETDGLQWKSKEPVVPLERLTVSLQDFTSLKGRIKWSPKT